MLSNDPESKIKKKIKKLQQKNIKKNYVLELKIKCFYHK